jgi:hypothetical protein
MIRPAQERLYGRRYREIAPAPEEQELRPFAAAEAVALGLGGVSLMARIQGLTHPGGHAVRPMLGAL